MLHCNQSGEPVRLRLDGLPLAGLTGNGVRVAIVDSGVHASHPHVGNVVGGIRLRVDGQDADYVDVLGHGTAVTAAIHEKAPDAELIAVKIFDRQLTAGGDILARAICYAAGEGARLVNLSLGTTNLARAPLLERAVAAATAMGGLVVAAREVAGTEYLPGILRGVASVLLDWTVPRDELEITEDDRGITFRASGYPRPIPGVPADRNLSGASFAVANVTGFLARLCEIDAQARTPGDIVRLLSSTRNSALRA